MPYVKPTGLLHNTPGEWQLALRHTEVEQPIVLRGKCQYQGKSVFRTHLAQPYPTKFGVAYGLLARELLDIVDQHDALQLPRPMAEPEHCDGLPQQLEMSESDDDEMPLLEDFRFCLFQLKRRVKALKVS